MKKIFKLNKKFIDHLNFYLSNSVSPVRQNIKNLKNHFQRRENLYNKLSLSPLLISKSRILEVVPGSGFNSLYTMSKNPIYYELVEPNDTACKDIKNLLFSKQPKNIRLNKIKIQDFKPVIKYDVILCECWIGSINEEVKILNSFQNKINENGIIVITFQPAIGMLANTLRKIISFKLINRNENIEVKTKKLSYAFSGHLKKLKHMSRLKRDWIIDVLINPATLGSYLAPETIFNSLDKCEPLSVYPYVEDGWRWYKSLIKQDKKKLFIKDFYSNYLNFLDSSMKSKKIDHKIGLTIDGELFKFYNKVLEYENSNISFNQVSRLILNDLKKFNVSLKKFNIESVRQLIEETINILEQKTIAPSKVNKLKHLSNIFGRELCYLSLKKI